MTRLADIIRMVECVPCAGLGKITSPFHGHTFNCSSCKGTGEVVGHIPTAAIAMRVTQAMIRAASRAEYDYYQAGRRTPGRFIPTPDSCVRAMLKAALATVEPETPEPEKRPVVVVAKRPGKR